MTTHTAFARIRLLLILLLAALMTGTTLAQDDPETTVILEWPEYVFALEIPEAWGTVTAPNTEQYIVSTTPPDQLDPFNPGELTLTLTYLGPGVGLIDAADPPAELQGFAAIQFSIDAVEFTDITVDDAPYGYLVSAQLPDTTVRAAVIASGEMFLMIMRDPNGVVDDAAYQALLDSITIDGLGGLGSAAATDTEAPVADDILVSGEFVDAELILADTTVDTWRFDAQPGDFASVYLQPLAENFSPQVTIAVQDGEILAAGIASVDFPILLENIPLTPQTAPEMLQFVVNVEEFMGEGMYQLRFAVDSTPVDVVDVLGLDIVPNPLDDLLDSVIPLQTPAEIRGEITQEMPEALYSIEAETGQYISVQMVADDDRQMDTFVELYADDRFLQFNDNEIGESFNAVLPGVLAPQAGIYYIRATSVLGFGEYTLRVDVSDVFNPAAAFAGGVFGGEVFNGDVVTGEITDQQVVVIYTINARAGQQLGVSMAAGNDDLDPLLRVLDADLTFIAGNDDAPDMPRQFDSRIDPVTIPADGTYFITANRFDGTGPFTLTVTLEG